MEFVDETESVKSVNMFIGAGSNDASTKAAILGGYGARYVVGGTTLHQMQSNILEWKFLPKNAIAAKRIQTVNEILNLPKFVDNTKTLCGIIKEIYNLPDEELLTALSKSLGIKAPLEISMRRLYYVWRDLIELVLAIMLEKSNIKVPPETDLLANIDIIEFKNAPELKDLSEKIKTYNHKGYCPHEPVVRILNLFTFPLQEVMTFIKKKYSAIPYSIDLIGAYKKIEQIISQIKTDKLSTKLKREGAFPDSAGLDSCMEKFLSLYRQMYPFLEEREQSYINSAEKITKICNVVENIIIDITK